MAKTKQKKKKSNKNTVDSEILRYVIALAAITVTLIAALQLGKMCIRDRFSAAISRRLSTARYMESKPGIPSWKDRQCYAGCGRKSTKRQAGLPTLSGFRSDHNINPFFLTYPVRRKGYFMEILKVSTKSNPNSVAGALANLLKENDRVEVCLLYTS